MTDTSAMILFATITFALLFLLGSATIIYKIVKGPRNPRNNRRWRAYARSAMQGLTSNPHVPGTNVVDVADTAAKTADAMMEEERKQK